jgi:hypothetical protein
MPNQRCEEAMKFLDACETEAMLRAQKEGLSPGIMQAIYRIGMPGNDPIQDSTVCLDRLGYSFSGSERPQPCPGKYCFEKNAKYYQFWNEKKNGRVILKHTVRLESQVVATAPIPIVLFANVNHLNSYFVGSEDELEKLGVKSEVMTCPNTGKPCDQPVKVYEIGNVAEAFLDRIGMEDVKRYVALIKEEIAKMDKKDDTPLGRRL